MFSLYTILPFLSIISAINLSIRDQASNARIGNDIVKLQLPNHKTQNLCMSREKDPKPGVAYISRFEDCSTAPEVRMQLDGTIGKIRIKNEGEEVGPVLQVFEPNGEGRINAYFQEEKADITSQDWVFDGSRIRYKGKEIGQKPVTEKLCLGIHYYDSTFFRTQLDPCAEGADPEANVEGAILQDWKILEWRQVADESTD